MGGLLVFRWEAALAHFPPDAEKMFNVLSATPLILTAQRVDTAHQLVSSSQTQVPLLEISLFSLSKFCVLFPTPCAFVSGGDGGPR